MGKKVEDYKKASEMTEIGNILKLKKHDLSHNRRKSDDVR